MVSANSNKSSLYAIDTVDNEDNAFIHSPDTESEEDEGLRNIVQANISYQGPKVHGSLKDFARGVAQRINPPSIKEKSSDKWTGSGHKDPFTIAHSETKFVHSETAQSTGHTAPTGYGLSIAAFGSPHSANLSNLFARDTDFDFNGSPAGAVATEVYGDHKPDINWRSSTNHSHHRNGIGGIYEDDEDPFDDDHSNNPTPPYPSYAPPPFLASPQVASHTPPYNPVSPLVSVSRTAFVMEQQGFD
jgi:hypothetical protein